MRAKRRVRIGGDNEFPHLLMLVFLLSLAAVLRFHGLAKESVWYDEAVSISQANSGFLRMLIDTARDNYPPLHNIVLYGFIKVFGASEFVVRLPSAIAGWLSCLVLYVLGKELFGRTAALVALALMATSLFHIYYSQEARMYSFFILFAVCSMLMFVRSVRETTAWNLAGYAAATAAMLYSHFFALFTLMAQAAFLFCLWASGNFKSAAAWKAGAAQGAAAALFAPWIPLFLLRARDVEKNFWIETPTIQTLYESLTAFAGSSLLIAPALLFIAGGVYWSKSKAPSLSPNEKTWAVFLALWMVWLFFAPFLISVLARPIFLSRYIIPALAPLYLLVGLGAAALFRASRLAFFTAAAFVSVVLGVEITRHYFSVKKEDARQAMSLIESRAEPHEIVVVRSGYRTAAFDYYKRRNDIAVVGIEINNRAKMEKILEHRGIWVVSVKTLANDQNCEGEYFQSIKQAYLLKMRADFYNVGVCYYRAAN